MGTDGSTQSSSSSTSSTVSKSEALAPPLTLVSGEVDDHCLRAEERWIGRRWRIIIFWRGDGG